MSVTQKAKKKKSTGHNEKQFIVTRRSIFIALFFFFFLNNTDNGLRLPLEISKDSPVNPPKCHELLHFLANFLFRNILRHIIILR